jgi:hypothetical protein
MASERGAAPLELALGIGLILIPAAVVALSVAPVFEHYNFARRAAAEAARTLVLSAGDPVAEALAVVDQLSTGHGVEPEAVTVSFCGGDGCPLARGTIATVEVAVRVPQVSAYLPLGDFTVRAVHSEQVDPYRSRP